MTQTARTGETFYQGIAASAGICQGKILILGKKNHSIIRGDISESEVASETERLEKALVETRRQISEVQHQVMEAMGDENARIFEVHLTVLEDPMLVDDVRRMIERDKVSAEYACSTVSSKYIATLESVNDEYLKERVPDMRDVTGRILNNLLGFHEHNHLPVLTEPTIVIADDLTPSLTAQLDRNLVLGFATDVGSRTSHTAILARSMQKPAVVGLKNISNQLKNGQHVLIDGFNGYVILHPTDQTLFEYGQLVRRRADFTDRLKELRDKQAITLDGYQIALSANVEQVGDTEMVKECGAEGVGLFRTEFLFLNRQSMPTEDEQYEVYRKVASELQPHPVVIRTLDLGGDKFLSHLELPLEMNPFLGWRAIRFCLQEKAIFCTQLRALLRASVEKNIKMMYPMISGVTELDQANELLEECKRQLSAEGTDFNPDIEVGVMIEIPSAVMIADALARRAKFFSLGTNDLIQYTVAVDRLNERIAHLYEPAHPAIVRLIKLTVDAAHANHIEVGLCGEMGGEPEMIPLLIGLGVDEISAAPSLIPAIKHLIRRLKRSEAQELAEFALKSESATEILSRSRAMANAAAPELFKKE